MLNLQNLNTLANVIQLLSYQELMEQATADDIMQELQHQNKEYLETIIKQNKEILERLKNGKISNNSKN